MADKMSPLLGRPHRCPWAHPPWLEQVIHPEFPFTLPSFPNSVGKFVRYRQCNRPTVSIASVPVSRQRISAGYSKIVAD